MLGVASGVLHQPGFNAAWKLVINLFIAFKFERFALLVQPADTAFIAVLRSPRGSLCACHFSPGRAHVGAVVEPYCNIRGGDVIVINCRWRVLEEANRRHRDFIFTR